MPICLSARAGSGKLPPRAFWPRRSTAFTGRPINPCGVCDSCKEIAAGNSLDVLEIDGASNNGVEQVRELRDNVRYAPAKGRYKIYIIDEVHMLTPQAFNALLKTLEEPPEHVKFIFATTEPQKVLPTILSRCQRFDLHRIPANLIAQHLQFIAGQEKITLEPAAAHAIARGADGGLRDAESMLDQLVAFCGETIAESDVLNVFGFTSEQTVAGFTEKILRGETSEALAVLDEQAAAGKEMMKLMSDLIAHLRDLLVFKVRPDALSEEAAPELQSSLGEEAALIETDRLLELIEQFAEAEGRMKWAPNKKLHFEVAVIKAIQTLSQVTLDEVIENLAALRGGDAPTKNAAPVVRPMIVAKPAPTPKRATSEEKAAPRVAESAPAPTNSGIDRLFDDLAESGRARLRPPSLAPQLDRRGSIARDGRAPCFAWVCARTKNQHGITRASSDPRLHRSAIPRADRLKMGSENEPRARLGAGGKNSARRRGRQSRA